jgi:hypothetical protein
METEQYSDARTLAEAAELWHRDVEYLCGHAAIPAKEAAPGLEGADHE